LMANWSHTTLYHYIAAHWREFMFNVNETPRL